MGVTFCIRQDIFSLAFFWHSSDSILDEEAAVHTAEAPTSPLLDRRQIFIEREVQSCQLLLRLSDGIHFRACELWTLNDGVPVEFVE